MVVHRGHVGPQPVVTFTRTDQAAQGDELFPFSVRTPAQPGEFTLPTVQTYESGTAVQWIGPEDSEELAPVLLTTGGAVVPAALEEAEEHTDPAEEDHGEMPHGGAQTGAGGSAQAGYPRLPLMLAGVAALLGAVATLLRWRRN